MSDSNRVVGSGDGTRPTTAGTVDNIGAGEKFSTKRDAEGGEVSGGPAPRDRMHEKRRDVEGTAHDDSAPYYLREDLTPETNKEKLPGRDDDHEPSEK